jgi:hypothetical protein
MMDHTQYRSAIMADPHDPDADLRAHREACAECRAFTEQLLRFEARLERALLVDIPTRQSCCRSRARVRRHLGGGWRWPPACCWRW